MPAPQMFPPSRQLRSIRLDVEDLTHDLIDGLRVTLRLEFTDGMRATVLSRVVTGDLAGTLPDEARSLLDAFMWGEGSRAVLLWAQRLDRSAMSRQVRASIE